MVRHASRREQSICTDSKEANERREIGVVSTTHLQCSPGNKKKEKTDQSLPIEP